MGTGIRGMVSHSALPLHVSYGIIYHSYLEQNISKELQEYPAITSISGGLPVPLLRHPGSGSHIDSSSEQWKAKHELPSGNLHTSDMAWSGQSTSSPSPRSCRYDVIMQNLRTSVDATQTG